MLGRQEKIKPLRQPGQYDRFTSPFIKVPFFTGNDLFYRHLDISCSRFNLNLPSKNLNTGPTFSSGISIRSQNWFLLGINGFHKIQLFDTKLKKVGPVFEYFEGRFGFLRS